MFRALAAAAIVLTSAAPAQVGSYESGKQSVVRGDPDKIVCQKEEKIGSRLGAKKVCLTAREWTARHSEDRDSTERIQSGAKVCSLPPCEFGKEF
ncbi:MAG: hypothetical protein M3448_00540 [Pseudomonadota bacterium]|nr:hypothetical protein [Pseudomonadota bacterium]